MNGNNENYDILTEDQEHPQEDSEINTKREPNNEVLVGLLYAFIGTFSYGLISCLVTATSALNFSPFYLLLIRAIFQVIFFSIINLVKSKSSRDAESEEWLKFEKPFSILSHLLA